MGKHATSNDCMCDLCVRWLVEGGHADRGGCRLRGLSLHPVPVIFLRFRPWL